MAHGSPLALPKKAAGKLMTTKVPVITIGATIADTEKLLLKDSQKYETINYIYVINTKGKLVGVCSVKELFTNSKSAKITDIMEKHPVSVHVHTHQERVAYEALKYNIKAMPVTDKKGNFLGVVDSDDILSTLYEEMQEDLFRSAGVRRHGTSENVLTMSVWKSIKNRLPWLIIGLLGGLLAAKVVGSFEATLEKHIILAAFIPLIVYMADAAKTQMEIFIIRDFATNPDIQFGKYFLKQLTVILFLAVITSIVLFVAGKILYQDLKISMILGIGLFSVFISSVFPGLLIPYFFTKIKLDPANASGPVSTIIQDIFSIIIYFCIAIWLL
jgi:magnesium transporter